MSRVLPSFRGPGKPEEVSLSTRKKLYWPALGVLTAFFTLAMYSTVALASPGSPSITSDQPDYAAGSVATLIGSGWQGDNSVAITVDDNIGKSWSWSGTATPDTNGDFTITVTLSPNFIAEYLVTATGSPSGAVATATFTDSVGLNILGTDGSQHQNPSDTENLGNVSGAQNFGISVKGTGLGGGSTSFSLSLFGAANGASVSPSSGTVSGSTATPVTLTINTSSLTVGTTYTDALQATGGPSVTSADYYFTFTVVSAVVDTDHDGISDTSDNCPNVANPGQEDADHDGIGDACDTDRDGDGVANATDNCPDVSNPTQADADHDGIGDACDPDRDGDGVANATDNCPEVANPGQADADGDHIGDACDPDRDGDGVANATDNCPEVANPGQADADGDHIGDACDSNGFAPAIAIAAADTNGNEGVTLQTHGSFTDQDGNSTLTITKDSGAGIVTDKGDGTWSWSLPTTDDSSGSVTVKANDGEHAAATDTFNWSAANVAPTVTIDSGTTSVNEGAAATTYTYHWTDPGADTWSTDISCGATGTRSSDTFDETTKTGSFKCAWADDNPTGTASDVETVSIKVSDDDLGSDTKTRDVTVSNVAPAITSASFGGSVNCGTNNATLSVSFTDPGADSWDASIDWDNNGTYDQTVNGVGKSFTASHTYGSAGSHTASVKVNDDDLGVSSASTATVWVNYNLSSILQPINDTGHGQLPSIFKYGSTVPVKVEVTECDGSHSDNLTLKVTWVKGASSTPAGTDESVVATTSDAGNTMRFSDPIYILNLDTKKTSTDSTSAITIFVSIMNGNVQQQTTSAYIGFKK